MGLISRVHAWHWKIFFGFDTLEFDISKERNGANYMFKGFVVSRYAGIKTSLWTSALPESLLRCLEESDMVQSLWAGSRGPEKDRWMLLFGLFLTNIQMSHLDGVRDKAAQILHHKTATFSPAQRSENKRLFLCRDTTQFVEQACGGGTTTTVLAHCTYCVKVWECPDITLTEHKITEMFTTASFSTNYDRSVTANQTNPSVITSAIKPERSLHVWWFELKSFKCLLCSVAWSNTVQSIKWHLIMPVIQIII